MSNALLPAAVLLIAFSCGAILYVPLFRALSEPGPARRPTEVGIGTVRTVDEQVTLEVECPSGWHFVGSLRRRAGDQNVVGLRPGVLLLVTFDPGAPELLSLADDVAAVRNA